MTSLKLEIGLSLGLHVIVITALLLAGSMATTKRFKPGEIIKVSLTAGPAEKIAPVMTPAKPVAPTITQPTPIPTKGAKALPTTKKKTEPPKKKSGVRKGEEARFEAERANNEIVSDATASGSPFAGATVDNAS